MKRIEKRDRLLWALGIILILILVGVIIFGIFVVNIVRDTTSRVIAPVEAANEQIRTQVAEILHPTPTVIPDPITIVRDVRALARLETIQYTIEKVITAEIGQGEFGFLFGDRLLFVAHGIVIAGIDFRNLENEDIWIDETDIYVNMPATEIFVSTLDNDKSYVYDREQGILTKGDQNLETLARQAAEDEIEKAAIEDGIIKQAQDNAEVFLERFLLGLGFRDVIFVYPLDAE